MLALQPSMLTTAVSASQNSFCGTLPFRAGRLSQWTSQVLPSSKHMADALDFANRAFRVMLQRPSLLAHGASG